MCINKGGMAWFQAGSIVSPLGLFLDFKAESESLVTQQCLRILVTCIQTGLSHGVSVFPLPVLTRSQGGGGEIITIFQKCLFSFTFLLVVDGLGLVL